MIRRSMDSHDLGRDRGGVRAALATIGVPALVVGIDGDVLYPLADASPPERWPRAGAYS